MTDPFSPLVQHYATIPTTRPAVLTPQHVEHPQSNTTMATAYYPSFVHENPHYVPGGYYPSIGHLTLDITEMDISSTVAPHTIDRDRHEYIRSTLQNTQTIHDPKGRYTALERIVMDIHQSTDHSAFYAQHTYFPHSTFSLQAYPQVIGILIYVAQNARFDIQVHANRLTQYTSIQPTITFMHPKSYDICIPHVTAHTSTQERTVISIRWQTPPLKLSRFIQTHHTYHTQVKVDTLSSLAIASGIEQLSDQPSNILQLSCRTHCTPERNRNSLPSRPQTTRLQCPIINTGCTLR